LPLVGQVPARKPTLLHFPKGESDFVWHIVDRRNLPVRDCSSVRATLYLGRSTLGVGGTPVSGFSNVSMQTIGDGDYLARITISIGATVGTNYVTTIEAKRNGERFGYWEEPSEIVDA
jgi:hypothetical protein